MRDELLETLRRLAEVEPGALPVITAYLDLRPQATGENPGRRAGLTVLRDRLREIEETYWPRGPAYDSVRADVASIEDYLAGELLAAAQGAAIFACAGRALFETIAANVPFEDQVTAGPTPDLFQLARLLDAQETAVVAVVDTNTARLFVTRTGRLEEIGGPDDKNTKMYRKRSMGGWKQMDYQRTIDNNRAAFAKQSAAAIERLVEQVQATHLILAGDEVAIPLLKDELSPAVAPILHDEILRVHIRAPRDEIEAQVMPLIDQAEAEASAEVADQLIAAVRADGLGVVGLPRTRQALDFGEADRLLLAPGAAIDEETRADLVRLASLTGAEVEVVEAHAAFDQLGGIGALLRYRHDEPRA